MPYIIQSVKQVIESVASEAYDWMDNPNVWEQVQGALNELETRGITVKSVGYSSSGFPVTFVLHYEKSPVEPVTTTRKWDAS